MRLHSHISNEECIGQKVCASIGKNLHWVKYSDGNDGEEDYYRDVFVDGHCVYMDGDVCEIRGYNEKAETITMYCENSEANGDGFNGVFTITYEMYWHDFGKEWMPNDNLHKIKAYTIEKLIYAQMTVEAETEEEAIEKAKTEPNSAWNICEFDASEDYSIVDEDEI